MSAPRLEVPDAAERDDLAEFVGRAVRLDAASLVRLRAVGERVAAWATTPFDVLVHRDARGTVAPADTTVTGSDLLAALAVAGGPSVGVGRPVDERWRGALPGPPGWSALGAVSAADVERLAARAADGGPALDEVVLTVGEARVPMRCVLALVGTGLTDAGDPVGVSAAGGWLRLDTPGGAVVHRRWTLGLRPS